MINPFDPLAAIAESQLGTQEDTKHTNRGEAIAKYQAADNYRPAPDNGYPWCASFVDWCVEQFLTKFPNATTIPLANRPQTAAAFGLRTWGLDHGCNVFHPLNRSTGNILPQRGDLVVFAFSHCGIVTKAIDLHTFQSVEGNTNDDGSRDGYEVARRTRDAGRVLCFIRLPVRA